jgi:hypothetical protein
MTAPALLDGSTTPVAPPTRRLVVILGVITFAFMAAQVAAEVTGYGFTGAWFLSLENESGLAERFGQAMAVAAAVTLLRGRRVTASASAGAWALVWLYIAADDAFRIHETAGEAIGGLFGGIGPLDPHVTGELAFMTAAGAALLGLVIIVEIRTGPPVSDVSRALLVPAAIFGFFSVVVDVAASKVPYSVAVEDGGEMFALGLALIASVTWYRSIGDGRSVDGP